MKGVLRPAVFVGMPTMLKVTMVRLLLSTTKQ